MRPTIAAILLAALLTGGAAAQQPDPWYDFIAATYERHDADLDDYVVAEVDRFAAAHPGSPRVADALYLKGRILEQDGEEHRALLTWLRLARLYPSHDQAPAASDAVIRIAAREKDYEESLGTLRSALELAPPSGAADRRFAFLELVTEIMHKNLREPALPLYRLFGRLHPADSRQVRALEWEARVLIDEGDEVEAGATLAKAEMLFPDAPAIPLVMRRRALLLADELDQPARAIATLEQLRATYPEHPVAAVALRDLARIKADEKDYQGAAADLRSFADAYPDHEQAAPALLDLAELTYDELEAWQRTDAIYEEIVTRYPDHPRAVEALRESAKLNEKRLENDERAAAQYARVGELFPAAEDASDDVFEAADIAADELENRELAAQYLRQIIATWPDSKPARKAREKLDKLLEE